jgi:hypothetical protein
MERLRKATKVSLVSFAKLLRVTDAESPQFARRDKAEIVAMIYGKLLELGPRLQFNSNCTETRPILASFACRPRNVILLCVHLLMLPVLSVSS